MTLFWYIGFLLMLIPVQTILLEWVSLNGIKPDVGLWAVYTIGLLHGEGKGAVMGGGCGLLIDLFTPGRAGVHMVVKAFIGYFSGVVGHAILETRFLFHLGMVSLFSFLQGVLIYTFLRLSGEPLLFGESLIGIIIPQAVYDGAVGGILISFGLTLLKKREFSLAGKG